jgi:hypothetical protein
MPIMGGGGGGAAFNGGTITGLPLTLLETNGTSKSLVINTQGGAAVNALEIDAPHTSVVVDGDGTVDIGSDDTIVVNIVGTGTPARLEIASTSAGANGINLQTDSGLAVTKGSSGAAFYAGKFGVIIDMAVAPADGDLDAGQVALWFDPTNGAAALNIKAKQANGTVKTATIPVIT